MRLHPSTHTTSRSFDDTQKSVLESSDWQKLRLRLSAKSQNSKFSQLLAAVVSSSSLAAIIIGLGGTSALAQITIQSTGTLSGTIQLPSINPNFNQSITRVDTDDTGTYSRNLGTKNNPNYVPIYKSDYVQVQTRNDGSNTPTPTPIVNGGDNTPTPPPVVSGGSTPTLTTIVDSGDAINVAPIVDSGDAINVAPIVDSGSAIASPTTTTHTSRSTPSLSPTSNMEFSSGNSPVNQILVNPAILVEAACSKDFLNKCTKPSSTKVVGPRSRVLVR